MKDTIGKLPKPKDASEALREIRKVARDKRAHVMLDDHCKWLELKLRAISILASRGLKVSPRSEQAPAATSCQPQGATPVHEIYPAIGSAEIQGEPHPIQKYFDAIGRRSD